MDSDYSKSMSDSTYAIKTASSVCDWSIQNQILLLKIIIDTADKKIRDKAVDFLLYKSANERRVETAAAWMKRRYEKDMAISPSRMADMYIYYSRHKRSMKPLFILVARRTRKRLLDRNRMRMYKAYDLSNQNNLN